MRLGLTNTISANDAGGLNPDGLALDLQFAADKAYAADGTVVSGTGQFNITSRKGPPAKFTRGSGATFVDSDGLIKYAPENLWARSEQFDDSYWSKSNVIINPIQSTSPIGTNTADNVQETATNSIHRVIGPNLTYSSGVPYTVSFYAKAAGRRYIYLNFGIAIGCSATFDIESGNFIESSSGVARIENIGNGWYRCSITGNGTGISASGAIQLNATLSLGDSTYQGDGSSGIILWGAQLERHTSARAYIPTTTTVAYAPRFDHDPVSPFACRGLLIEESRTNIVPQSQNLSAWVRTNSTLGASITSPDGTNNANSVVFQTATSSPLFNSDIARLISQSFTAGQVFTASVYLKASSATTINFGINGATQGSNNQGTLVNVSTSWQRFSVTCTVATNDSGLYFVIGTGINGTGMTYLTARTIDIWGAQIEAGSFATSYIPTTTSPLTRSADVCSITGDNFTSFWNRFAGTAIIGVGSSLANSGRFISNTTSARALEVYSGAPSTNIDFFEASGAQEVRIGTLVTFPIKVGLAYAINDYQSSYNGLLGGADTNTGGTIPDATAFYIGTLGGSSARMTGHIQFIRYYKKRLPNAKLQALTA